jgi:hypothetical protein
MARRQFPCPERAWCGHPLSSICTALRPHHANRLSLAVLQGFSRLSADVVAMHTDQESQRTRPASCPIPATWGVGGRRPGEGRVLERARWGQRPTHRRRPHSKSGQAPMKTPAHVEAEGGQLRPAPRSRGFTGRDTRVTRRRSRLMSRRFESRI